MKYKNRTWTLIVTIVLTISASMGITTPAYAATKNVTIEIGNWNCRIGGQYKGSVNSILIDVIPGKNPAATWVAGNKTGRNITYNPNGSSVRVVGKAHCKTWWGDPGYYVDIVTGRWVDRNTSNHWKF